MTIGNRIAQKRKERGLSQEALGEQLGVSRQAIYKWESDAALPEIEKLIALSRLFGVSVGWLLGVEEAAVPHEAPETAEPTGELTETQLKMVEEIVARYLAAQPRPLPRKRRTLLKVCIAAAGICFAVGMYNTVSRLDRLNTQYNALQNSVSNINSTVNNQINGISNRVESILKAQNALTADYSARLTASDLGRNTVTFALRAVPKTYQEGMSAVFLADSGDGPADFPADLAPGRAFVGEATVELTDSITLSVVFIYPDGTRQTQLLDTYEGLLSVTFPDYLHIDGHMTFMDVKNGVVTYSGNDRYVHLRMMQDSSSTTKDLPVAKIASAQVGLFRNRTLLTWLESCPQPATFHGFEGHDFYCLPENYSVGITREDTLCFAVFVTDEYGRELVFSDSAYCMDDDSELTYASRPWAYRTSPDEWTF
ncbi:MAG: helix-turn-helix domain-containing protein [Ruminococcaceae bacterium]|nr:helix-turn-helix domain-containing protein [Oscillospiraceae bacterium]